MVKVDRGRWGRVFSPAGLVLAGLLFLAPFLAVSCDAPGGYGRAAPGGTTTYTGWDLATGGTPDVTEDHLLPAAQRRDDVLPPQPLAGAVLVLLVIGVLVAAGVGRARTRRGVVAALAAIAALFLLVNQATVRVLLEERLREQLSAPLPAGKEIGDFVHDQGGFAFSLLALVLVALGNLAGWVRLVRGPRDGDTRAVAGG
ncbi:hypothetical protein CS0771_35150 [Catellatospora sp. IY07-71]|uniref:hypothetical protein n=1 Tax=Catellatospora sp. IY07-71 TaxID=2728827 RepID=UPI001BB44FA2|nr:hypothetical protein [Catellatospora sp. IY07-71]BCJ73971.1 hypothetical protein CS0771_35150 [Catellatospora sp. IY07-71]